MSQHYHITILCHRCSTATIAKEVLVNATGGALLKGKCRYCKIDLEKETSLEEILLSLQHHEISEAELSAETDLAEIVAPIVS